MKKRELAAMIDHTILKATATEADVKRLCAEARENGFASVCVNPVHVALVSRELAGSKVRTCCVIGFPLGANASEIKAAEAEFAVSQGAEELDMVINVGALKAGDETRVRKDIAAVVDAVAGRTVKVIIETCYLSDDEKRAACRAAMEAKADFVKTSTGFGSGGAKIEDIKLMRETVGDTMKIKASGGIRSYADALAMVEAGADRIGASSGIAIIAAAE
ncbi:deoxyribose-phosphate aldolase [Sediminispirochaeta bajacaliforniensis]|uniref:deoxyribose-phosphate aldolase n=1 Tax=Sediminispirochaeta bajacaliforniensis TaxID=148 RepID=UPI000365CF07|nr:deoxyribose-phosphate aldolase [Sediminispirochaeta bajacaliforniensis]